MADYEKAIRKVLKNHFPDARISGCWFHYVKNINKAAKKFGFSEDDEFKRPIQEAWHYCRMILFPKDSSMWMRK